MAVTSYASAAAQSEMFLLRRVHKEKTASREAASYLRLSRLLEVLPIFPVKVACEAEQNRSKIKSLRKFREQYQSGPVAQLDRAAVS